MPQKILMIAGPNGAGKTTMASLLVKNSSVFYEFINADEIAKGLAPLHPESVALAASKLMIRRMQELLNAGKSFAFETTAAGTNYVKHLKLAKMKGYEISLAFLWLSSPKEAIKRVMQRVKQGGHYVPEDVVARRYYTGVKNLLTQYLLLADRVLIINNSQEEPSRGLVARKNRNGNLEILDKAVWRKIECLL